MQTKVYAWRNAESIAQATLFAFSQPTAPVPGEQVIIIDITGA